MNEEIKARLKKYQEARRAYTRAKEESEQIATMLTSAAIDYSKVKVQTSPHDFTDTMAKLVDLHNECVKRMAECVEAMEEVNRLIELIETGKEKEVLFRRYIAGEAWEEIAEQMKIDYRWAFRLHNRGIEIIEEKIK